MGFAIVLQSRNGDRLPVKGFHSAGTVSLQIGDGTGLDGLPSLAELQAQRLSRSQLIEFLQDHQPPSVLAEIHVTGNYSRRLGELSRAGQISREAGEIFSFYRISAAELLPKFVAAKLELAALNEPPTGNYWDDTAGNIISLLETLEAWALEHPDGVFVDVG